jgi:methylene-tetrahydromethanopterin dehydrogenase
MKDPYLLHMFNPTKNVSPFDVNMAYEADFDGVIPYTDVSLDDIHSLTQDTIFSRGPSGVKRTDIFIGGRELGLALDMLKRAKAAMVPPFEVSVFADPSGAITTAAALIALVEHWVHKRGQGTLAGKRIFMIGTGPIGVCAGVLAAYEGAKVVLVSYRGTEVGEEIADQYNRRFKVEMEGGDNSSTEAVLAFMPYADIAIGASKAGIRVLSTLQLQCGERLMVAADVNAVPPLGIEGIGVYDNGVVLKGTPKEAVGIGALAIGNLKYKVHHRLFRMMIETDKPIYIDHKVAFDVARQLVNEA